MKWILRSFPTRVEGLGDFSDMVFRTREEAEACKAGTERHHPGRYLMQVLTQEEAERNRLASLRPRRR